MTDRIVILDTTLRADLAHDVYFTTRDRLDIASELAKLKVDFIEAGQPAKSALEEEAVRNVAGEIRTCRIAALVRCIPSDIEAAASALEGAEEARLHVYSAISDPSRDRASAIESIGAMVKKARNLVADVEFSLQNGTGTDSDLLADALRAALSSGARTFNVTDAGFILPDELASCFARLRGELSDFEGAILSFHGHDDLGVATANSITAVRSGARQLEVAVNGIGDVGGNTPLEEVLSVLRTHGARLGVETTLETSQMVRLRELVEERRAARLRSTLAH
jgi:2-isopropylmalate synthase